MQEPRKAQAMKSGRKRLRQAQRDSGPGALPDFVVIGTQKGGTSFFYGRLGCHPLVRPAVVKEIHFFDRPARFARGLPWYGRCFPSEAGFRGPDEELRTITGEATPSYLFDPRVPERMARAIPAARLFALLRNPIDRAYSHYRMQVRRGTEARSFEEAVDEELAGEAVSPYLARGIYADQLARYSFYAQKGRLLVLKSEDLFARPQATMDRAFTFLGLPAFEPKPQRNKSKGDYPPMDPTIRERLQEYFEPHNRRLYDYLGVDFGWSGVGAGTTMFARVRRRILRTPPP